MFYNRLLTTLNIAPVYGDVVVAVRAFLLVVEAQGVDELMHDGTVTLDTTCCQLHTLSSTSHTHVG